MKSKNLKINIIYDFIISGIESFVITFLLFSVFFGMVHICSYELYCKLSEAYNLHNNVMIIFLLSVFMVFIFCFLILFIRKMNKITSYIDEICINLEYVSQGNMKINIPVIRKDELGNLAEHVNKMAYDLNELMEKETAWDRQKNNLITNLSHDLRTPLTSIIGFLKLITEDSYNGENLKHYLSIILNKSLQLKKSIDQLFEFSKINNYDLKIDKQKICINELVKQMLVGFMPEFENNNMQYRINEMNGNAIIEADSHLLVRAFENIVTNSIKYAKEGKFLDIVIENKKDNAEIKFINYGEKIDEEDLDNIFDKYYRIEKSCRKKEGNGLGMAIVKTIVQLHNGEIEVFSNDKKTEFKIILPN